MKLLAIIDDEDDLTSLRAIVRAALPDAVVLDAANGADEIELAATEDADVILLDIGMPGMDGLEICRRLKSDERLKDTPLVFLASLETYARSRLEALVLDRTSELRHQLGEVRHLAEEWQTTFDSVSDAIWILNSEMRVVRTNTAATQVFEREPKDMLGKHCWEIVHGTQEPIPECPVIRMRQTLQRESTVLKVGERWLEVTVDPVLDVDNNLVGATHIVSDITERKRAADEIGASEARFRSVFESANVGKSITLVTGEINVNRAFCEMLGYRPEELRNKRWQDLTPEDEIAENEGFLESMRKDGADSARFVKRYLHKDGSLVWCDVHIAKHRGPDGEPLYFVATVVDITERRLAEESLRESTERYRRLFESMLDGFALHEIICDEAGRPVDYRYLEVNPAFERTTGLAAADLIGKTAREIFPGFDPAWIERFGSVALTGEPFDYDFSGVYLPGEYEVTAYSPRRGQFATIAKDVASRRQAEATIALQAKRSAVLLELPSATERMTEAEFMRWGQERAEELTASEIGFIHFVSDDEQTIQLVTWSARTLEGNCRAAVPSHYPVSDAGVWADAVRQHKPLVLNDYPAHPHKHGLPEGHVALVRLICVPVIENGKVVMLAGVGNKVTDYTDLDVETVQLVSNEIWRIVLRRRAEEGLRRSEESYRTLTEQVPAIIYRAAVDEPSTTTYISHGVEILGYAQAEWLAQPDLWTDNLHPEDRSGVLEGLRSLHEGGSFRQEYRFKDKSGRWHDIRDEAVLIRDPLGKASHIQGVMVDITESNRAAANTKQALEMAVRRGEELEGLLEATRAVQEHVDFASAARRIFDSAKRLLGATCGFLALLSGTGDDAEAILLDCAGLPPGADVELRMKIGALPAEVIAGGMAIVANDFQNSPMAEYLSDGHVDLQNVLVSPLTLEGTVVGLLALANKRGGFAERDSELAAAFSDVAALAYKNAREMDLRQKAEESLRLSERRYRELFENPFTGVAVYEAVDGGRDFVLIELSASAERLVGRTRKEVVGKRLTEAFAGVGGTGLLDVFRQVYETGEACHHPLARYLHPGGQNRWFENHVHRLPSGEIVALFEDVTTQQEAQVALREGRERYALLFDTSNDAIFVHTLQNGKAGRFVEVNEVACSRLGYRRDELLQMTPEDVDEASMDMVRQRAIDNLMTRGHTFFEMVQVSKAGERLPIEMSSRLFQYKGETLVMSLARDITERKQAEGARETLQAQLVQAQKMESVGRLAGGVAHDFNNMLSIILGYGESIAGELHPEDPMREQVDQILEAARRSADLTRQLLAFSRKQTLQAEVLDLNNVVSNLETMLRRLIGEHIELELSLSEEAGRVLVDPGQMEQVIMNLVVNARDAMPAGGKLVMKTSAVDLDETFVLTHPGTRPGRYALLAVTDTGCGMTEEVMNMVFEPFFTTKETGEGTGLGLSTVYGIVKQSGGNVWAFSEPGRGATFEVYFPQTEGAPVKKKLENEHPTRGGEHVLVVEDEEGLRGLMDTLLPRLGYKVTTAADGGEALLLIEEGGLQPDLIITDVVMPNMSGTELISLLRKSRPHLKVLYMSGYTDDAIIHHGVLDPSTPFIQKPFSIGDIAAKVRVVLDGEVGSSNRRE